MQSVFCLNCIMVKLERESEFFSIKDTLECGQVFRFRPYKKGFFVFSLDKCCYAYNVGDKAIIECEDKDSEYFENYFDLKKDYSIIVDSAQKSGFPILEKSAVLGKGIRILNQNTTETVFSFIVSQNNNIPRIKGIIEKLCFALGTKKTFMGEEYYTFPKASDMAKADISVYKNIGLGYRAEYIKKLSEDIEKGFSLEDLKALETPALKKALVSVYGIGPKVADCSILFGYHRLNAFPVDVWIEKVYREDFNGTLTDRNKISEYFVNTFKENSGYFQQYLFYYKRSLEK